MPRPLVLGNTQLLINYDRHYQMRDLYYPYVGQYNHVVGERCKFGIYADSRMSWSDNAAWKIEFRYIDGTLVGHTILENDELAIRLTIFETVHPVDPLHVRKIEIQSLRPGNRTVKLMVHTDLRIQETDIGDTALYHPDVDGLIHYKFNYAFLLGGQSQGNGLSGYTTGMKEWRQPVGSWQDAEDGKLESNAISQGAVDSCYSIDIELEDQLTAQATTWMLVGESIPDVLEKFEDFGGGMGMETVLPVAEAFYKNYLAQAHEIKTDLADGLEWLYHQSQLIIRSQCDSGGAILAANDSDILDTNRATYSFLWPRDGALVGRAMDLAGHPEINKNYQYFAAELVRPEQPYFLHKYAPDGTLGASWHPLVVNGERVIPFQQDETSLTIFSLGHHLGQYPNAEMMQDLYHRMVAPACDFMDSYRDDEGVPLPSWDLWEERRGVHCYTVATTIAAFREAAWMAEKLGDLAASRWKTAEEELIDILRTKFWNANRGAFYRMLGDETMDSATLSVVLFGALPADDPQAIMAVNTVDEILNDRKGSGGVARYEGDYYFRQTEDFPGNPWVICTMWLAQVRMMQAKSHEDLKATQPALDWVLKLAEKTGILSEQYHPATAQPLSVSPLTWSHAEYVASVGLYQKRWNELA